MPQFYLPQPWSPKKPINMPAELAHHLRVRRIQVGETVAIFDGAGMVAKATILEYRNKSGLLSLSAIGLDRHREAPYAITLAQALAAGDKMDWIVEKAVETGAQSIIPLQCERSLLKLMRPSDAERAQKRHLHWQAIVQAACEQCDRTVFPTLEPIQNFEAFIARNQTTGLKLLLSPNAPVELVDVLVTTPQQNCFLLIGPEGGHSPSEEAQAIAAGYLLVSLGKRILRTETAGIVAIATVHAIWH
ncbi:16S ribosomal RNA methyltransferase RsmE [Burkholderiaceae bacterium]|jgi:16S rRNA (uracil1498-N3)-methyltransferase